MKILIVSTISGPEWAGSEEVWYRFARLAMAKGHEVMLAADHRVAGNHRVLSLQEKGLLVSPRRFWRPARLYLTIQKHWHDHRMVNDFNPDVCLISAGSPFDIAYNAQLEMLIEKVVCPVLMLCQFNSELLDIPARFDARSFFSRLSGLAFVSELNRQQLSRQTGGWSCADIVIPNTVKFSLDQPVPWPANPNSLACVARLETRWKGQERLLEALAGLEWQQQCVVNFFGDGPDKGMLKALISSLDLETTCRLVGQVDDIVALWKDHALMVLPSLGEGMPLAVLEAMMCGRPTLGTRVGIGEIIEDGITGFIAEDAEPESLRETLQRAWKQRGDWEAMGVAAFQQVQQISRREPESELLGFMMKIMKG